MKNKLKRAFKNLFSPAYIVKEQKSADGIDGHIVTYTDTRSYIAEQYKVLRTNLNSLSPDKPFKTIVITSSQAQEGKSVTASNLAVSLSVDHGKKGLLIDADLRKPSVHRLFSVDRKPGLSDILRGTVNLEKFLEKPVIGDLYIIPAGASSDSPAELLGSVMLRNLLNDVKLKFDFVIFDTPPVLNVTDATIIGSLCDVVIMVVKQDVTQKTAIEEAFNSLTSAHAKPKACILTGAYIPSYYYYKYKYYYGYSYQNTTQNK